MTKSAAPITTTAVTVAVSSPVNSCTKVNPGVDLEGR